MRQYSWIAISLVAVLAGGCQFFGGGEPEVEEPAEVVTEPTDVTEDPTAPDPAETDPTEPTEPFAEPTVVGSPPPPPTALPPDLIASTSPAARLQQIQGRGADPFAPLGVTPIVQIPPEPPAIADPTPATPASPPQAQRPSPAPAQAPGRPGQTPGTPDRGPAATAPVAPTPPPPPPTDLARGVEVTGVVQVGSQVFAIVKAPNEPTSRYVQPGQSLSNGQVLLKRIDMSTSEPVVILEQSGVEVTKIVGSTGQVASAAISASF